MGAILENACVKDHFWQSSRLKSCNFTIKLTTSIVFLGTLTILYKHLLLGIQLSGFYGINNIHTKYIWSSSLLESNIVSYFSKILN